MKRMLILILLLLLLCGCTAQPQEETTTQPPETTIARTEPGEPAGIYEPHSDLEIQTGGAVRCYLPELPEVYGMDIWNGDMLIFSGTEVTTLTRMTGDQLYVSAQIILDTWIDPADTAFQISANGITYYCADTDELVFLDNDLKEVRRLALPAELVGKPVLSSDRTLVYYCTADAVRVYDTATGLDKLLKSISHPHQTAKAVLAEDSVLCCTMMDVQGWEYVIFISTQTGELVAELDYSLDLTTSGENYYVKTTDGVLEQVLFGQRGEVPAALAPADPFAKPWILEETHSAVTASVTEESTTLDHYDLATGKRTASVELPGGVVPIYVEPQAECGIWLLARNELTGENLILLWDRSATAAADETVYTGIRYTAENPDEAGLADCAALAENIGNTYGVKILVGEEAVAQQPWDYTLTHEYQSAVIRRELEVLETVLAQFPEGFFEELPGTPHICIVRAITGNAESGSVAGAQGLQFWEGETAYVALAAGDGLEQSFFHEIFHIIDSRVLSVCRLYYQWDDLNPEGCEYFNDYTSYRDADVSRYLQEEDRAFIDAYSMSYPREDRARIMEYACMEGNAHYFQSEVMQSKLKLLCQGIRKAFRLEKYPESFLWEQYLNEPLTP